MLLKQTELYLPRAKAKGGGRDEQQEPFEEGVFSFLCPGSCGAAGSPEAQEPCWKFTINKHVVKKRLIAALCNSMRFKMMMFIYAHWSFISHTCAGESHRTTSYYSDRRKKSTGNVSECAAVQYNSFFYRLHVCGESLWAEGTSFGYKPH